MLFDLSGKSPKQVAKIAERHYYKLVMSPKYRREFKKKALSIYVKIGKIWNEAVMEEGLDEANRDLLTTSAKFIGKSLWVIEEIEKSNTENKKVKISRKKYSIYLHKSGKRFLVEVRYFKSGYEKRKVTSFLIFRSRNKAKRVWGVRYSRRVSKMGYILKDSGTFFIKMTGFWTNRFLLRGKKKRILFPIRYITKKRRRFNLDNPHVFQKIMNI